ncbi:MAG: mevalonate kinase [Ardenticatenales bacterium]
MSTPLATVSAPAKVILLGEHAVLYGQPAIAVPFVAVGVEAVVTADEGGPTIISRWPDDGGGGRAVHVDGAPDDDPLAVAARAAFDHWSLGAPSWRIELDSTIPTGRGLGSSAAVAVALVHAIAAAAGERPDPADVAGLALRAEQVVHGRPSGIDNTTIAFERPIWCQAGSFRVAAVGAPLGLVVADTGRVALTRAMVEGVRRLREADPAGVDAVIEELGDAAEHGAAALARGDGAQLGAAMTRAHAGLKALAVSTNALDQLVSAALGAGAFGAELAGSGGGGVIIAVCEPGRMGRIAEACRAAGATWAAEAVLAADDGISGGRRTSRWWA